MDQLPGRRIVVALAALAALGLLAGYGMAMRARPKPATIALDEGEPVERSARRIFVHVGGGVGAPGLYELSEGARVNDAVDAAGGPAEDADLDGLNLAAKVKDGDKILVPRRGGPSDGSQAVPGGVDASGRVNLNAATLAELETLPGIGPALAQRIIDFRTERGGFRRVEDLMEVSGIGPKTFENLKDHVTV